MGRLTGKNILFIIPKDYYNEEELDALLPIFKEEGAGVRIASSKMKVAVGMKNGRVMPDVLIVDAIEGIVGDSYVTGGSGTRQIKGVFHGVVVIGGNGARSYLWNDKLVRLLLVDRHRSGFVVSAIGMGVPCLGVAGLIENQEVAMENNKHAIAELEKANALVVEDRDVVSLNLVVTGKNASAAKAFAEALIEQVAQTPAK